MIEEELYALSDSPQTTYVEELQLVLAHDGLGELLHSGIL